MNNETLIIRTAYAEHLNPETVNNEPSLTKQSLAEALDVNNIIKRYNKTGILQQATNLEAQYGDITSMDLRDALEMVNRADNTFMQVPSEIRAKFNNDAGAFIDFATNKDNLDQLREWGLANKPDPVVITMPDPPKP